jgi:hypothetical protein
MMMLRDYQQRMVGSKVESRREEEVIREREKSGQLIGTTSVT